MCLGPGCVLVREADLPRDDGHKPRRARAAPRSWKRQAAPPVEPLEGAPPCPHLEVRLVVSRTGRETNSHCLKPPSLWLCCLFQQPRETLYDLTDT